MQSKLFIPRRIKVGFVKREGTFTGVLAYVIYYDEKGVLRKQASWERWRAQDIEPVEFDNHPVDGFVLNKGLRRFSDWGSGRSVIRVHDARGFEFEISVDNLMGLLMHSDVSKRDIMEKCIFAWAGPELVLLPVNSDAYRESQAYTAKQDNKLSTKALQPGRRYSLKKGELVLTYLGFYPWYAIETNYEELSLGWHRNYSRNTRKTRTQVAKGKKHVFHDGHDFVTPSVSSLSECLGEDVAADFSALVDAFFHTTASQPIVGLKHELLSGEAEAFQFKDSYAGRLFTQPSSVGSITEVDAWTVPLSTLRDHAAYPTSMRRQNGNALALTGLTGVYTMEPSFKLAVDHSDTNQQKQLVAINLDGSSDTAPEVLCREDYTVTGLTSITLSTRFMTELRNRGLGRLYFILQNGNLCPNLL